MSVLACERYGCRKVMCDILVENRYICNDCATEFRESVGNKAMPIRELSKAFQTFMDSEKSEYGENRIVTVDEFLG